MMMLGREQDEEHGLVMTDQERMRSSGSSCTVFIRNCESMEQLHV